MLHISKVNLWSLNKLLIELLSLIIAKVANIAKVLNGWSSIFRCTY